MIKGIILHPGDIVEESCDDVVGARFIVLRRDIINNHLIPKPHLIYTRYTLYFLWINDQQYYGYNKQGSTITKTDKAIGQDISEGFTWEIISQVGDSDYYRSKA